MPDSDKLFLQLPNGKMLPLATLTGMRFAHTGVISIATNNPEVRLMLRGEAAQMIEQLQALITAIRPCTVAQASDRVLTITPEEVVAYFESSVDLQAMAMDVREVLLGKTGAAAPASQLESDLAAVRRAGLVNPSKADISELLTGARFYSGAIYRRVSAVYAAITSSSTPKDSSSPAKKVA